MTNRSTGLFGWVAERQDELIDGMFLVDFRTRQRLTEQEVEDNFTVDETWKVNGEASCAFSTCPLRGRATQIAGGSHRGPYSAVRCSRRAFLLATFSRISSMESLGIEEMRRLV
jgi:hypothetical protein